MKKSTSGKNVQRKMPSLEASRWNREEVHFRRSSQLNEMNTSRSVDLGVRRYAKVQKLKLLNKGGTA